MDGEIYDDVDKEPSFHFYYDLILPLRIFVFFYRWYILGSIFLIYQINLRLINPWIERLIHRMQDDQRNADPNRYRNLIRVARNRQQQKHQEMAAAHEARKKEKLKEIETRTKERRERMEPFIEYSLRAEEEVKNSSDSDENPAEFLLRIIHSAPIVIVSRRLCSQSKKAKKVFETYGLQRDEIVALVLDELGKERGDYVEREMTRFFDLARIPSVFIGGHFIGSSDSVVFYQQEGILDVLVRESIDEWREEKERKIKDQ